MGASALGYGADRGGSRAGSRSTSPKRPNPTESRDSPDALSLGSSVCRPVMLLETWTEPPCVSESL